MIINFLGSSMILQQYRCRLKLIHHPLYHKIDSRYTQNIMPVNGTDSIRKAPSILGGIAAECGSDGNHAACLVPAPEGEGP